MGLRYKRNAIAENTQFPSSYNLIIGSLFSGPLSDLQSSNNVYVVFASSNGVIEVEFIGSHGGHLPFLQVLAELKTSISIMMVMQTYNYEANAYETSGTMYKSTSTSIFDTNYWLYSILNCKKYRSLNGEWKIKIKCTISGTPPPSFTLSIDYLYYRTIAYELGISNTTSAAGAQQNVMDLTLGIRVWKVNSDDSETEIDGSNLKAPVTGPSQTTILNATYTPTQTANVVALVIRVYQGSTILSSADLGFGGIPMVFITEDINDTLQNTQWTVYYAFYYNINYDETYYRFGSSTYPSRIDNINFGSIAPYFPNRQMLKSFPSVMIVING